jgi:2-polyprenyl-3-methyl-5-hydroxy-6-metoxy-1,4-benzoquinol methylase
MHDPLEVTQIIGTEPRPTCLVCGRPGRLLYDKLTDKLFSTFGEWTLKKCVNKECGLVWLDPTPRETELWKLYANYYTHTEVFYPASSTIKRCYYFIKNCYISLKYGYFRGLRQYHLRWLGLVFYLLPARRANIDFSVMYLANKPGGKLLEIGCGNGEMLKYLNMLGWQTEGIDVDPVAVEKARSKGLKINLGSLHEQEYNDNIFDAVILSHVIEHVPNPLALLSEIHRILKPGGKISLVTPNTNSFGKGLFGNNWFPLDPPRHLLLFNNKTLLKSAQMAGFNNMTLNTTVREAASVFFASLMLKRNGAYQMGTPPHGMAKLFFKAMCLVEWALLKIFRNKGEEISFIGIK